LCTSDKKLVIEAFPRSANTFSVALACLYGDYAKEEIASHHHAIGQFKRALQLDVPSISIIREPRAAIISLIVRRPKVFTILFLIDYYIFYSYVLNHKDEINLVTFDQVTNNTDELVRLLFNNDSHVDKNAVFQFVDDLERQDSGTDIIRETHVARPVESESKVLQKNAASRRLDGRLAVYLLKKCDALYAEVRKSSSYPLSEN
jgi:hypothetical protein